MSHVPPDLAPETAFYLSKLSPCPYLAGYNERKVFTRLPEDPNTAAALNGALTQIGFRRSHDVLYRPTCPNCRACVPVRVAVADFQPSRTQRRVLRRHADLRVAWEPPVPTAEQFALFQAYQTARHSDSAMAQMDEAAYREMLCTGNAALKLLTLRDAGNKLHGVLLADGLSDGTSAVYSFFAPDDSSASLGTLLVLQLIATTAATKLPYVYLGYGIEDSRKMAYKAQFQPQEHLGAHGWARAQ